jgi:AcrR family transcriptional regulator
VTDQRSPRRGRQAEAERNDRRVLEAAQIEVARHGADATVAAIADRAGVGIGSLYRRYGSKEDLLRNLCVQAMDSTIEAAQAALAEPDAWAGLAGYVRTCVAQRTGALGPLAGTIATTRPMWTASKRSRELLARLVGRAREDGSLRSDVTVLDIAWLIETLGASGRAEPAAEDDVIRARLAAIALDGLRSREHRPAGALPELPGPPPGAAHYEQRWHAPAQR